MSTPDRHPLADVDTALHAQERQDMSGVTFRRATLAEWVAAGLPPESCPDRVGTRD